MDITSTSDLYSPKQQFPYLVRTASSDYYQVRVHDHHYSDNLSECNHYFLIIRFGVAALSTFQQLAQLVNISVVPVQVDAYVNQVYAHVKGKNY